MLFVLSGDVQTGKTRWLSRLVEDLAAANIEVVGVLAPGVWRERSPEELARLAVDAADAAGKGVGAKRGLGGTGAYEKLGIDNRLLPDDVTISFARRSDLVEDAARVAQSQSGRAKLGWAIADTAIAQVNAHFDELRARLSAEEHAGGGRAGASGASAQPGFAGGRAVSRFAVVDELGPLELVRGGGLASALALLDDGPRESCSHALAIVRPTLVDTARERFEPAWGRVHLIAADDAGRAAVLGAYGMV